MKLDWQHHSGQIIVTLDNHQQVKFTRETAVELFNFCNLVASMQQDAVDAKLSKEQMRGLVANYKGAIRKAVDAERQRGTQMDRLLDGMDKDQLQDLYERLKDHD